MNEKRSNEIFGGTFLIGLAVLFLLNWWWPGIMFVIGIALIVRAVAEGRPWMSERGGLIALGIGVIFAFFSFSFWPIILIAIGLYLLLGNRLNYHGWGGKWGGSREFWNNQSSSEDKPKHDDDLV